MAFRTLRSRLLASMLLFTVAVITAMSILGQRMGRGIIDRELRNGVQADLEKIAYFAEKELAAHARSVSLLAGEVERAGIQPKPWYVSQLRETLRRSPNSFAFGIWYEPYRYDPARRYFGPYNFRRGGRIVYTDEYNLPTYDYHHWDWYTIARPSRGEVVWSRVYFDPPVQVYMVTATAAFYDRAGKMMGVVTGDISLSSLQALVGAVRANKPGWALLIDVDGRYIVSPDLTRSKAPFIQKDANPSLSALGRHMMATEAGIGNYRGPEGLVHVFYRRLPGTNWLAAVAVPDSELYRPLNRWIGWSGVLAAAAMGLASAWAAWISRHLAAPVSRVAAAAGQVAQGRYVQIPCSDGQDEVADLVDAFNHMAGSLEAKTQALERGRAHLQAVVTSLAEGLLLVGPDDRIIEANRSAERLLGLAEGRLSGTLARNVLGLGDGPQEGVTGKLSTIERPDGSKLSIRVNWVALADGNWVVTFRDVTTEEEVARLKSEFISLASHELRTPMAIAKGYVDLLTMKGGPELEAQQQLEMLQKIDRQIERLNRIITDLLNVSRIEQRRVTVRSRMITAGDVLEPLCQNLQLLAAKERIDLAFVQPDPSPVIFADPELVIQIVSNLIENAIKYSPPERRIDVSVETVGERVRINVADQGIGIPPEALPHLFEKFYRVSGPATLKQRGTGLGLYISRQLAELQGGQLLVSSEWGRGSTFSLLLPSRPAQVETIQASAAA